MESWSVGHHFEEEPATDPSHYETVNELCIGHGVSLRSTGLNVVTQTRVSLADSTPDASKGNKRTSGIWLEENNILGRS